MVSFEKLNSDLNQTWFIDIIWEPSIQFNSIQLYFHKNTAAKIHTKDIYTTKSYGGVGWKANEA